MPGWWTGFKRFRGANMSLLSRRFFANGGDESDCLDGTIPCVPSTIEEMDPAIGYPQRVLVTANETTTGQYFFGDPGVGGSVGEPIADRYVVWFGTQRLGYSNTLNKYDRVTGNTTTITFDPVEGAYPKGKLLDLGNGTALGFMDMTKPTTAAGKYGYVGGPRANGAGPGFYVLDLGTGGSRAGSGLRPIPSSASSTSRRRRSGSMTAASGRRSTIAISSPFPPRTTGSSHG